jgi:hypothetical protein
LNKVDARECDLRFDMRCHFGRVTVDAVERSMLAPDVFEHTADARADRYTIHCVPLGFLAVVGDDFFSCSKPTLKLRWLQAEPHDEVASACTGILP